MATEPVITGAMWALAVAVVVLIAVIDRSVRRGGWWS